MTGRPNFLWLVAEDCSPRFGAWGDRVARTPVIDRLAQEGVRFKRAYSTAPVCAPSRFAMFTGVYAASAGPAHHMSAEACLPDHISGVPTYLRQVGYYCANNAKTHYNARLDAQAIWNESSSTAHWSKRAPGQPFFAVFNFGVTHESGLFDYENTLTDPADVRVPGYLPDLPGIRADIARTYDLIAELDDQLGKRLAELSPEEREDTIVFVLADHGGIHARSKRHCYEEGVNCPLVVWFPPKWRHLAPAEAGAVVHTPVSWIDLPPTLLSLAGAAIPDHMQGGVFLGPEAAKREFAFSGRNRMDERYDFVRTAVSKRYRYIRNYMPHLPLGQHQAYGWMARGYQDWESAQTAGRLTAPQRRFWKARPFEELYDLDADGDQIDNLAARASHEPVLTAMREALDRHMVDIRDNGFLPENHPAEGYEKSRDGALYPLERAMRIARLAARRDESRRTELTWLTADASDVCRYWAVIGLVVLAPDLGAEQIEHLRGMAQRDPSGFVRVAAAEAVIRSIVDPVMTDRLLATAERAELPSQRLMALNALTYAVDRDRQLGAELGRISRLLDADDEYLRNAARYLMACVDGSYRPDLRVFDMNWYQAVGLKKQNAF